MIDKVVDVVEDFVQAQPDVPGAVALCFSPFWSQTRTRIIVSAAKPAGAGNWTPRIANSLPLLPRR